VPGVKQPESENPLNDERSADDDGVALEMRPGEIQGDRHTAGRRQSGGSKRREDTRPESGQQPGYDHNRQQALCRKQDAHPHLRLEARAMQDERHGREPARRCDREAAHAEEDVTGTTTVADTTPVSHQGIIPRALSDVK